MRLYKNSSSAIKNILVRHDSSRALLSYIVTSNQIPPKRFKGVIRSFIKQEQYSKVIEYPYHCLHRPY